jgi:hypothetical protein
MESSLVPVAVSPSRRKAPSERDWSKRVEAWVERACAEHGVPVKLSDPLALAEIAEILLSGREKRDSEG